MWPHACVAGPRVLQRPTLTKDNGDVPANERTHPSTKTADLSVADLLRHRGSFGAEASCATIAALTWES
jgi:hypothetical protein